MDLVLISPTAKPPVCKIMDYGKFRYESIKREKELKKNQKIVEIKEVWLSATIDVGDLQTKAKLARKFLENGDKVKVGLRMRGRQQARPELAIKVMLEFNELLKDICTLDKQPVVEGRNIIMFMLPIKK